MRVLLTVLAVLTASTLTAEAYGQDGTVDLRDITVTPLDGAATIRFLVNGPVDVVVIERVGGHVAQVRMKSIRATSAALNSALPKPGLKELTAHVERTDVLVVNARFEQAVGEMSVIQRDSGAVVVHVKLHSIANLAPTSSDRPAINREGGVEESLGEREPSKLPGHKELHTVVIDAGHGGKDPGAIGLNGAMEKWITLAMAKTLKEEIEERLDVKVVLTRDDDTFIELYRRGEIANEADGSLFISLHCNAMPEKPHPVNGFEAWILRPGKSDDAARIAARENSAIQYESNRKRYDSVDAEIAILGSLTQSAAVRYSEKAAAAIIENIGRKTSVMNRGVRQAGFYVLVGAAMPAILIELGYLTNETDVKRLQSPTDRKKIAAAIAEGIASYSDEYARSGN